ncbi:hypothetical protein DYB32_001668 [Aphanomyces invadans]|uniref:Carbohydrate kinase FGGY C-terminal domain-containing protein n=1 Tax=Aphanomyces invadans TaxID=157072 RepID=A0A3R6W250_9STRA|nr:hypothetical protein DYB32_001668 [Aphanomyces invadans]
MRVLLPVIAIPKVPRGLFCYRVTSTHAILGGALTDGGSVFEWARQTLALPPGRERAPGWHEDAKCTISGITAATTPVHILRAALESVALRLGSIYALLGTVNVRRRGFAKPIRVGDFVTPDAQLIASGTALSASPAWRQIIGSYNC